MPTLLIPTRNRPASLQQVLEFLARFHPGSRVIVADGSDVDYSERYLETIAAHSERLQLDYRRYESDLPYLERVLDVLGSIGDEFVAMGADDDFPNMDVLDNAELVLRSDATISVALATNVNITLAWNGHIQALPKLAPDILEVEAKHRIKRYELIGPPTTYALARRSHLIERYKSLQALFVPSVIDLSIGLADCIAGKIKAVEGFGYFITRNFNHTYLRRNSTMEFMKEGPQIFALIESAAANLETSGYEPGEAWGIASSTYARKVTSLCDASPESRRYEAEAEFLESEVGQRQERMFSDLFSSDNPVRTAYSEKLRFVLDAVRKNSQTEDNKDELKTLAAWKNQPAARPYHDND